MDEDFYPSEIEVDFDKNVTELYEAITNQDWEKAVSVCKYDPEQAATWVVRHYEEEAGEEREVMWRFLPLHSACARQPPSAVVSALLRAYPDGAKCRDDQGMYALHYACGNQASRDVIRLLLVSYPEAAKEADPRGMLAIHYLACWGPSTVSVVDMLLVANRDIGSALDADGNTPLDLAKEGDYPEKQSVMDALSKWMAINSTSPVVGARTSSSYARPSFSHNSHRQNSDVASHTSSHHSRHSDASQHHHNDTGDEATATTMASTLADGANERSHKTEANDRRTPRSYKTITRSKKRNDHHHYSVNKLDDDEKYNPLKPNNNRALMDMDSSLEEKKDDDDDVDHHRRYQEPVYTVARATAPVGSARGGSSLKPAISPDELKRLRDEIRDLKLEKASWENKLSDAQRKVEKQAVEILDLREELKTVKESNEKKLKGVEEGQSKELLEAKAQLRECKEEAKGLRETLGDMMDDHEKVSKKNASTAERVAKLTSSLESMVMRQTKLAKSIKQRDEKHKKALQERQSLLKELCEITELVDDDDSNYIQSSMKKQQTEMEAVTAILATVRS